MTLSPLGPIAVGRRHRGGRGDRVGLMSLTEISSTSREHWMSYSMPLVAAFVGWAPDRGDGDDHRPLGSGHRTDRLWASSRDDPAKVGPPPSGGSPRTCSNRGTPLPDRRQRARRGAAGTVVRVDQRHRPRRRREDPSGLWDSCRAGRRRAEPHQSPGAAHHREDAERDAVGPEPGSIDLQFLSVTTLVRNKEKLNKLMRGLSDDAMAFVRRSGIYFGLIIGTAQMFVWAISNCRGSPAFGFGIRSGQRPSP